MSVFKSFYNYFELHMLTTDMHNQLISTVVVL